MKLTLNMLQNCLKVGEISVVITHCDNLHIYIILSESRCILFFWLVIEKRYFQKCALKYPFSLTNRLSNSLYDLVLRIVTHVKVRLAIIVLTVIFMYFICDCDQLIWLGNWYWQSCFLLFSFHKKAYWCFLLKLTVYKRHNILKHILLPLFR